LGVNCIKPDIDFSFLIYHFFKAFFSSFKKSSISKEVSIESFFNKRIYFLSLIFRYGIIFSFGQEIIFDIFEANIFLFITLVGSTYNHFS